MELAPASVHIALLDDHPLFRQGLRHLLQELAYVETITETAELAELQAVCRQHLPDVLLLDLHMPQLNGAEAAQLLLQEFPGLKIIVLSMFSADKFITQMIKLGARSYVPKDTSPTELTQAIGAVLTTGYHYTPRISQALARNLQQPTRHKAAGLFEDSSFTTREKEVLRLICSGLTTNDIADKLFISHRTVEGHRQRLLDKSGSSNVASLVAFAAKHNLLGESLIA